MWQCVVLMVLVISLQSASSSSEGDLSAAIDDLPRNESCAQAHEFFRNNLNLPQHLSSALPNNRPITVEKSMVCNQAASSCCTPEMETYFQKDTLEDFRSTLVTKKNKWINLAREQHDNAKDHYVGVIQHSAKLMDIMFEKTYGDFYSKRKALFISFFQDLENSFINSSTTVQDIFDKFYIELVREVFQLLNPHYIYTDEFLSCLASKPEHIMITGQPLRLPAMVEESFKAPHKLLQTLEESRMLLEKLFEEDPVKVECASKLSQLKFCARCQNNLEVRPCRSTCVSVVRDCLNQSLEIGPEFLRQFSGEEMEEMLEDLQGPYNMYQVIKIQMSEPISQAIMQLQGQSSELRETVLRDCAEPAINSSVDIPIIYKSNVTTKTYTQEDFEYNPRSEGYGMVTNESQYDYVTDDVDLAPDSLERSARSVREKRNRKTKSDKKAAKHRRRRRKNKRRQQRKNRDSRNGGEDSYNFSPTGMSDREVDVEKLINGLSAVIGEIQSEWKDLENVMCNRMSASNEDSQCWSGTGLITGQSVPRLDIDSSRSSGEGNFDMTVEDYAGSPGDMTSSGSGGSEQSDDEDDGFGGSGDITVSDSEGQETSKGGEGGASTATISSFRVWTLLLITWAVGLIFD